MLFLCHKKKFCISIVFVFSWGHFNSQEKLKTMLMQNFWVTNKEHYGILWYFLEWSILGKCYYNLRQVLQFTTERDLLFPETLLLTPSRPLTLEGCFLWHIRQLRFSIFPGVTWDQAQFERFSYILSNGYSWNWAWYKLSHVCARYGQILALTLIGC